MNEQEEDVVLLYEARYMHELRGGGDPWRLTGKVTNHPGHADGDIVYLSTPIAYNKLTNRLETASGRKYHIVNFGAKQEEVIKQIEDDIRNGGYEVH